MFFALFCLNFRWHIFIRKWNIFANTFFGTSLFFTWQANYFLRWHYKLRLTPRLNNCCHKPVNHNHNYQRKPNKSSKMGKNGFIGFPSNLLWHKVSHPLSSPCLYIAEGRAGVLRTGLQWVVCDLLIHWQATWITISAEPFISADWFTPFTR